MATGRLQYRIVNISTSYVRVVRVIGYAELCLHTVLTERISKGGRSERNGRDI